MPERTQRVLVDEVGFSEGPVFGLDGRLYVASITHGAVYEVREGERAVLVARTGGGANAVAVAPSGRLLVAQNGGRWASKGPVWGPEAAGGVQYVDGDGSVHWLTQDPIAPNDLCIGPDGLAYVTDPTRSTRMDDGRLWRVDPETGATELLTTVSWFCNGIAFGAADELYVASTVPAQIVRYDLADDGSIGDGLVVLTLERGQPDGITLDADGNILIGAISYDERPGTVQTWSPTGELLDTYSPGEGKHYTNLVLRDDGTLILTDSDAGAVLAIENWPATPLPTHPLR